jgi:hypothetical protein
MRLLAGTVIDCMATTATPSPTAVFTFFETARKVHMPRKKLRARFSINMALIIMLR